MSGFSLLWDPVQRGFTILCNPRSTERENGTMIRLLWLGTLLGMNLAYDTADISITTSGFPCKDGAKCTNQGYPKSAIFLSVLLSFLTWCLVITWWWRS